MKRKREEEQQIRNNSSVVVNEEHPPQRERNWHVVRDAVSLSIEPRASVTYDI
jgi:hypothetical protein